MQLEILSKPQPNLNSTVGFYTKMTLHHHHHHHYHHTNSMSAISQLLLAQFWWNFKGSFLGASRTDSLSWWHLSISGISQLLLTWFWWNLKGSFLGPYLTNSNCHGDICPCNICAGDIYPYQIYLSCYWPNFDQT